MKLECLLPTQLTLQQLCLPKVMRQPFVEQDFSVLLDAREQRWQIVEVSISLMRPCMFIVGFGTLIAPYEHRRTQYDAAEIHDCTPRDSDWASRHNAKGEPSE